MCMGCVLTQQLHMSHEAVQDSAKRTGMAGMPCKLAVLQPPPAAPKADEPIGMPSQGLRPPRQGVVHHHGHPEARPPALA